MRVESLAERGWIPDVLLRAGIRRRLADRLAKEGAGGPEDHQRRHQELKDRLLASPIAVHTSDANEQHYELPAGFFEEILGARLKYSSGYWPEGVHTLDAAEEAMLQLYAERAQLQDGMQILDLGCGWGSLSLWLCERYPSSRVTAVSNSRGQAEYIRARAAERGLENLELITSDINELVLPGRFDRILSIEMFEHMRNYQQLLRKLRGALDDEGKLFVHIFTHAHHPYLFEAEGPGDWMARHFFTGGVMPSHELLSWFQEDMCLLESWTLDGTHYSKTAEAWLERMDARRSKIDPILVQVYGPDQLSRWRSRWRLFFMACAELFEYRNGSEWQVSHYLFEPYRDGGSR